MAAPKARQARGGGRPAAVRGSTGGTDRAAAAKGIIAAAREMSRRGLSPGRSGNVSCRWGEGMLITPTGMAYDALVDSDIVLVAADGKWDVGGRKPSSEWRFHLAAYRARPGMHAIVHTHSMHAVVLACAHLPIPAFHYMVAVAGGSDIPCIPYATFGTERLAELVAEGLATRDACLMAHHGQIAMGETVAAALELAEWVEVLAEQYFKVRQLGPLHLLSDEQMAEVIVRFHSYGQKAQLQETQTPGTQTPGTQTPGTPGGKVQHRR